MHTTMLKKHSLSRRNLRRTTQNLAQNSSEEETGFTGAHSQTNLGSMTQRGVISSRTLLKDSKRDSRMVRARNPGSQTMQ
jgi:hypothetical protein